MSQAKQAVHEVRIPPQTPPGILVGREDCDLRFDHKPHPPHFWNPLASIIPAGVRRYCPGWD
jgi:hypothetical protein